MMLMLIVGPEQPVIIPLLTHVLLLVLPIPQVQLIVLRQTTIVLMVMIMIIAITMWRVLIQAQPVFKITQ